MEQNAVNKNTSVKAIMKEKLLSIAAALCAVVLYMSFLGESLFDAYLAVMVSWNGKETTIRIALTEKKPS